MQPIIRRTITITITETWTITWADGHETSWEETHTWPADSDPDEALSALTDDEQSADGPLDLDAADPTADGE